MDERVGDMLTVGKLIHTILSQKILVLIISFSVLVAGTLGLYFGYNRLFADYVITFTLKLPGAEIASNYYPLPGGERFYFGDYVSEKVISAVINGDNLTLGNIDAKKMVQNNDISLSVTPYQTSAEGCTESGKNIFKIRVRRKYFFDKQNAKNFLTALSRYPIVRYLEANSKVNYNVYLNDEDFKNAPSFEVQLENLSTQINYIGELYSSLSNVVTDENGTLVENIRQRFEAWVERLNMDALSDKAAAHCYLKNWQSDIDKFQNDMFKPEGLLDRYDDALTNLNQFKAYMSDFALEPSMDAAFVLAELQDSVTRLRRQITTYERYISAYYQTVTDESGFLKTDENTGRIYLGAVNQSHVEETEKFASEIAEIFNALTQDGGFLDRFVELNDTVYRKTAAVNYRVPDIIESEGGFGFISSALISLVAGIIIAAITAYIVSVARNKKALKKEETADASAETTGQDGQNE